MRVSLRPVMVVAGVCLLIVIVALLFRFVFVSAERRIEMTLKRAIEDIRNEKVHECMSHIAVAEWDSTMVTREQLRGLLEGGFDKFDNIRVLYDSFAVNVQGKRAAATFKAKVIAKYEDQVILLLGTLTEGREIKLGFAKEGKKWRIHSISGIDIPTDVFDEL